MPGRIRVASAARSRTERGRTSREVGGDGDRSGDDVEEDVPLGTEQHERDGTDAKSAADVHEREQQHRKERRGRHGCGDLCQGLCDACEAWMKADGDSGGYGPDAEMSRERLYAQEGGDAPLSSSTISAPCT